MSNSYSAEVWLNEHRWDALEEALEQEGTSIEKHLQNYLIDLYSSATMGMSSSFPIR